MNKTIKIYIGLLVLLFVGAIAVEFSKPKPINWTRTFNEKHKIPFGTYILHNELSQLFPNSDIEDIKVSPYEFFYDEYNWQDSTYMIEGSYLYIDDFADIDEISSQELLDFASYGNDIFISTSFVPELIKDSLFLETKNEFDFAGKAQLTLANPKFKHDSITITKEIGNNYFSKLDSINTTVLGYQKFGDIERVNFVKIAHGYGYFYVHLQPNVFTNYNLLKGNNKKYTSAILSYLPDKTIYFDSKNKLYQELGDSPLRFILSKPALKWAWYLALLSLLIFMIFNAKRKQRIVKVIKPLQNTTVDFTKTIGNLYYETKDHDTMIDKKITFFFEHIRRNYYIDTDVLDEKFVRTLALKTGHKKGFIQKLINVIAHLKAKQTCIEEDLLEINKLLEEFYTKINYGK